MNPNDYRIVRITNISNFDFIPEMGARFGGRDFPLRAGESRLYPFPLGDHLATHLARQIVIKGAPVRTEAELDGKGSTHPLWDDAHLDTLKKQILTDVYEESKLPEVSEADRMVAKVEQLNSDPEIAALLPSEQPNLTDSPDGALDASAVGIQTSGSQQGPSTLTYKDKADVIAELQKRNVTFNPRSSKVTLEGLLSEQ